MSAKLNEMMPMAVVGSGMVTAVGFNAQASFAAIRAKISGIAEDNIWDHTSGEYMCVARPVVPQWWEGPDMLAELAAPAVAECLRTLPAGTDPRPIPIFVLLSPVDRPHREADLEEIVRDELGLRLQIQSTTPPSVFSGRTSILEAFQQVSQVFANGTAGHAIVVGVDTFLRQRVVETYIEQRRVVTSDNSNGFIPGEAACAVLLAPPRHREGGELHIVGWGAGDEKGNICGDSPLSGDGLTQAIRNALSTAGVEMADTDYWLTDQNGEHYKAKECTIAQIRLERRSQPALVPYQIWHPIEFLGEIGSAIAPCLLGLGLAAARGGFAPGPLVLMHVGEDNGQRAALVLRWSDSA